jgi:hypothetical protein
MLSQSYVRWLVVITHPERINQSCQVKNNNQFCKSKRGKCPPLAEKKESIDDPWGFSISGGNKSYPNR